MMEQIFFDFTVGVTNAEPVSENVRLMRHLHTPRFTRWHGWFPTTLWEQLLQATSCRRFANILGRTRRCLRAETSLIVGRYA